MKLKTQNNKLISKICLGTWALGGLKKNNISYGNLGLKKSQEILDFAFKNKINFFDTANVYGEAEQRLGKFIKDKREDTFIATKVGCVSFHKKLNFSKKNIIKQIDHSLKNLNSDYIDLVQLYGPSAEDKKIFHAYEILNKLKNEKKINYIGISLRKPADYLFFRKFMKVDFVQCNFNMLDHRLLKNKLLNLINKDCTDIYARTVLNFGIFTEKFLNSKSLFSNNDHRSKWNPGQINNWKDSAIDIKKSLNNKIENLAYQYCKSFKISGLIIGATNTDHIKIAISSMAKRKLKNKEILMIEKIYKIFEKKLLIKLNYIMKSN
jgi:aryl-alcohol dehydrogenase-like predicted oxidoreductase